jgi:signal transduction histidine kinase
MSPPRQDEELFLILAPRGRDAEVIARVLQRGGMPSETLQQFEALLERVQAGAGAAIITDEALIGQDLGPFSAWLAAQEPWSDFPMVVLLSRRLGRGDVALRTALGALGNVVILERPLSVETLGSAADFALRARRRQYAARGAMADKLAASEALAALNQTLEVQVRARTNALAQANDLITAQVMDRERTQQALAHYQKMEALGRLTGGVAHDFNNLLSVIQGSVELISLLSTEEKVRARARTAKAACERGAKLTGQLLSFARNQTLDLQPLSVAALFDTVMELARPLLGTAIEMSSSIAEGAEFAIGDANQMEMALLNLAINARDAMDGSGKLSFHAGRAAAPSGTLADGDYLCIAVADNGPGMSPEIAAKVFEPFFTTKAVGKGTGLGLSQVYGMAQQSGGAALVRSVEGAGATVEIWLPAASNALETRAAYQGDRSMLAGLKILLVEDDDLVREGMVEALSSFGCKVSQAASGGEGLSLLAQGRPDLLLTDFLMPGMNGAELACKARLLFPDLPVLVATGYADMGAIESSVGENVVLRKPFALADLARAVASAAAAEVR